MIGCYSPADQVQKPSARKVLDMGVATRALRGLDIPRSPELENAGNDVLGGPCENAQVGPRHVLRPRQTVIADDDRDAARAHRLVQPHRKVAGPARTQRKLGTFHVGAKVFDDGGVVRLSPPEIPAAQEIHPGDVRRDAALEKIKEMAPARVRMHRSTESYARNGAPRKGVHGFHGLEHVRKTVLAGIGARGRSEYGNAARVLRGRVVVRDGEDDDVFIFFRERIVVP